MKIKSAWGIGAHAGKIVSVANGERGFIHLRSTLEVYRFGRYCSPSRPKVVVYCLDR
jgi:hypothetical protein